MRANDRAEERYEEQGIDEAKIAKDGKPDRSGFQSELGFPKDVASEIRVGRELPLLDTAKRGERDHKEQSLHNEKRPQNPGVKETLIGQGAADKEHLVAEGVDRRAESRFALQPRPDPIESVRGDGAAPKTIAMIQDGIW